MLVFFSVLVLLVRLVQPWSHVCWYFSGLSTLVRLVRPCSHVCWYFFGLSTLVRLVRPCSHVRWYFFGLSTLVRLVRPWSMYVGILSGLVTAMFLCMLVFRFTLITLIHLVPLRLLPFYRPYKYLDTPITDMVYGHCMAKSSAFLKQMRSDSTLH